MGISSVVGKEVNTQPAFATSITAKQLTTSTHSALTLINRHKQRNVQHAQALTMSFLQHTVEAIWDVLVERMILAGWRHLTSAEFMLTHEVWAYLVDTPIMDAWDDLVDYAICPWLHPWASLNQVLTPFVRFFWELLGHSPVFWFFFIAFMLRWTCCDYYRYVAVGRGATPPTIRGWWRTKYLSVYLRILRVNVLSRPFLDPTTEPYRGILFNLARRQGARPTILGLDPQRQDNQEAAPNTHAAMVASARGGTQPRRDAPARPQETPPGRPGIWNAQYRRRVGRRIAHVLTSDSSAHVVLHPADCAEVIRKGWGERPPLACAAENTIWRFWYHTVCGERLPLPFNMVLVYAPRNRAEMDVFARIVDAAVWFAAPLAAGVDASTPGETTPFRTPIENGVSPALNGVDPSLNGDSPVLNGVSHSLNGDAPALNGDGDTAALDGDAPAENGDA